MLQREALEILKTGSNIFLTGVPGAGKTYVINQYIKYLEDKGIYPAITASTGIAATHVGGTTIHAFSGIGIEKIIDDYKLDRILEREKLVKKIQHTQVLVIDEISMLDAQTLDNVNRVLKAIKNPEKAFGGIQVIFVGDFFQLPPVTKKGEVKNYAFASHAWKESKPLVCYLEEQYRQKDETFSKLLLAIRENCIDEMHLDILENLKKKTYKKFGLKLPKEVSEDEWEEESIAIDTPSEAAFSDALVGASPSHTSLPNVLELHTHNKDVDSINEVRLKQIPEKEFVFKMLIQGKASLVENLIKSCLSPEILKLRLGAKVIFTKNSTEGEYVNGTLGTVVELESFKIVVETKDGKRINLKQEEWKYEDDGKALARISQYPLRLAWAITVHKSQGMSLDEAVLNLSETFEYGQGYVALSRLRSLDGLHLLGYNPKSLQVNGAICEFDEKIRKDSRFIQAKFKKADKEKLKKLQENFILSCGGVLAGGAKKSSASKSTWDKDTYEQTLELILAGKTVVEIADMRDMSPQTIMSHVEHLYQKKKIQKLDLEKVVPDGVKIFNIPSDVSKSFKKNKRQVDEEGNIKLAPVFKDLKEKYSYDALRWYRLFL